MKQKTAQRFLIASGILALLGGGSCYLCINPPVRGDAALGWAIIGGLAGLGGLITALILGVIGLVGLAKSRRNN